ncbi:MAG: glycosyl hydrolase family 8 [Nanoarchaeota archaeon]|nr:glycosyl hydrolase family 8 [Nanoarchaeota archaeon]
MSELYIPSWKKFLLFGLVLTYIIIGLAILYLIDLGILNKLPPSALEKEENSLAIINDTNISIPDFEALKYFINNKLMKENGHLDLSYPITGNQEGENNTNSEAVSYYLLWNAKDRNKHAFDFELDYIEKHMLYPKHKYLMWRLNYVENAVDDGTNMASDADLRAIKALLIAEEQWGDKRYTTRINNLAKGLEEIAVTSDKMLAPYGGVIDGNVWKTEEVWLSYTDFEVFRDLAYRRGEPWRGVYKNMKEAVLSAQLPSGLYVTKLDAKRNYHNLDGDEYGINSLWVLVRSAESKDRELQDSARKGLEIYKKSYAQNGMLYNSYDEVGNPINKGDSAWIYALVGRAAIALNEKEFADEMMIKLREKQILDERSDIYGGFIEINDKGEFVSQFTLQEAILTVQDYKESLGKG